MAGSHVCVPVNTGVFLELVEFLRKEGSDRDPVEVVGDAIQYWMDNASWKPEILTPTALSKDHLGYRWKQVFLPHNTLIRMRYKGRYHYAKVEGDQIIYEGKSVSPSEFATGVAKTARNAWRDLEIKKPTDEKWIQADLLRRPVEEDISSLPVMP